MARKQPSWREIASVLANRLDHAYCEDHAEITEDCPFCADVAAYQLYVDKLASLGLRVRDPSKAPRPSISSA